MQKIAKTDLRGLHPMKFYQTFVQSTSSSAEYVEFNMENGIVSTLLEIDNVPKSTFDLLLESSGFSIDG